MGSEIDDAGPQIALVEPTPVVGPSLKSPAQVYTVLLNTDFPSSLILKLLLKVFMQLP